MHAAIGVACLTIFLLLARSIVAYKTSQVETFSEGKKTIRKSCILSVILMLTIIINGVQWFSFGKHLARFEVMKMNHRGGRGHWNGPQFRNGAGSDRRSQWMQKMRKYWRARRAERDQ